MVSAVISEADILLITALSICAVAVASLFPISYIVVHQHLVVRPILASDSNFHFSLLGIDRGEVKETQTNWNLPFHSSNEFSSSSCFLTPEMSLSNLRSTKCAVFKAGQLELHAAQKLVFPVYTCMHVGTVRSLDNQNNFCLISQFLLA